MNRAGCLATLAALIVLALARPCGGAAAADSIAKAPKPVLPVSRAPQDLEGSYRNQQNTATITFQKITGDFFFVISTRGWEGVGILFDAEYQGVFREMVEPGRVGGRGRHLIYLRDDGGLEVHTSYEDSPEEDLVERWHRARATERTAPPMEPPQIETPQPEERPKPDEYVYVEHLPEAITKVPPFYPDEARQARVEGTVIVQALVLKDGMVGDTRIAHSIPALDAAAVTAVRQWRFKPALTKGQPVAVWVAIPVKFALH